MFFSLCTHLIHKHSFRHHVDLSCLLSKSFSFDIVKLSHPQFYTSHWCVLRRCIAKPSSEWCRVSVKRVNMKNCQNVRMVKNFISSKMCFVVIQSKNFCTFVRELAVWHRSCSVESPWPNSSSELDKTQPDIQFATSFLPRVHRCNSNGLLCWERL